ncbi:MAG: hypothetical protein ABI053_04265 [Lacisediminihabitans sp.]
MARSADREQGSEAAEPIARRRTPVWLSWTVTIIFAVLFTYPLWVGIGNAVGYPQTIWSHYHLGINPIGWVLLILGVLTAPVIFVCSLLLGRSRGTIARVLIYAAGLCVVSAVLASLTIAPSFINFIA